VYGTIARMRIVLGHEQQLEAFGKEWNEQRGGKVAGFVASYLLTPDAAANERLLVAIFRDRESYRKNAQDPEQDVWYRRMREHLAADPEWTDGEIVEMS
jgi:hypothetical protein